MTSRSTAKIDWDSELQRNERWLRTVIFARLGEAGAVEDVFQDVALAAVKQAAPIADESKIGAWLYRLAVRHVLLYRRKMGRKRRLLERYTNRFENDHVERQSSADPLNWLLSEERRKLVRLAVSRLRTPQMRRFCC